MPRPASKAGAESRRLQHRRAHDRQTQQVGLQLHQEVVGRRAAVHAHLRDADGRVGDHRFQYVRDLVGNALQHCPDHVIARRCSG